MLQHLYGSLKSEESDISRNHKIMMNWYTHYIEVCEQLRNSKENMSDILQVGNTTTDLELLQQLEDQTIMQDEENR